MSDDRTFTKTEAPAPRAGEPSHVLGSSAARGQNVDEVRWAWATEHRAPERASTEQLVSWLARGELPPHTLVWRPGWGEWLPAMQVAELAAAFPSVTPGSRRVAQASHDVTDVPPPVPVAHYPRLRLLAKDVVGSAAPEPFTGIAPAPAGRRAFRDLDSAQKDLVTSQVPVAAMLEAARAMKRQAGLPPRGVEVRAAPERPSRLDFGTFGDTYNASPQGLFGSLPLPDRPDPETGTIPLLRTLSPHAVELGSPSLLEPEPSDNPLRPRRRYVRWLSLGALAGAALGLIAIRGPAPRAAAPASTAAQTTSVVGLKPIEPKVVAGACRLSSGSVRLDERALRDVPPVVTALSGAARVTGLNGAGGDVSAGWAAVGYAQSHQDAVGLALSPQSLEVQRLGARRTRRPITNVSPLLRRGELTFRAGGEEAAIPFARTVEGDPPLRIGVSAQGLVAGVIGEEPRSVWALPAGLVTSVPAVAAHPGRLTVALLAGRKQGPLRVGVMSASGEPLSELVQIGGTDARFGRPALASDGATTALAVAARSRDGVRQSIWLATAAAAEPPRVLQPFELAPEEPIAFNADLDMPAITALPGGSFALLFARGQGVKRRLQVQRLSSALAPLDAPVEITTLDPAFRGAGAGGLYWVNDRLLALHFATKDGGTSLWASSIECELR